MNRPVFPFFLLLLLLRAASAAASAEGSLAVVTTSGSDTGPLDAFVKESSGLGELPGDPRAGPPARVILIGVDSHGLEELLGAWVVLTDVGLQYRNGSDALWEQGGEAARLGARRRQRVESPWPAWAIDALAFVQDWAGGPSRGETEEELSEPPPLGAAVAAQDASYLLRLAQFTDLVILGPFSYDKGLYERFVADAALAGMLAEASGRPLAWVRGPGGARPPGVWHDLGRVLRELLGARDRRTEKAKSAFA